MLNRLMTSRGVRGFLFCLLILSAIATILSVALPLNRKKEAISSLGEKSLSEANSLALAIEYYTGPRIESLVTYPDTTAFYYSLCGFLTQAKGRLSYDRAYILYQSKTDGVTYLADGDYQLDLEKEDYHEIGDGYYGTRYSKKCYSMLNEQFAGRKNASYVPEILENEYITTYLPIKNSAGKVIAVLGIDAKLTYSDFTHYGPIDFEKLMAVSGIIFLVSLILFILCMDQGLSEEEKENRWRKRRGLPPKPVKKDKIIVDTLDDIDPNDYL